MDHEKKLAFVARMTKLGLDHVQHLDSGGAIIPSNSTGNAIVGPAPAATGESTTQNTAGIGGLAGGLGLSTPFQAQSATITPGTNAGQLNTAYTGAENAINSQVGTTNQLQPLVGAGAGTETALGTQLASEAAGVGPNAAQSALAESTGQNVGTTAAEIAGARGSNANVGLLTRGAASQGAATQEQGVASAATLQAQQQIAAEQAEAGLASTEVGQGTGAVTNLNQTQQNEQNILQGSNTAANNAAVAQQSNINNVNAEIAGANQNANSQLLGGITGTAALSSSFFAKGGMVKMDKGGNVLDANARKHIAPHNFALPGGRYPIHDVNHARNALARVSEYGTPEEKAKVKAAVHRKYPNIGAKKMDDGGDVADMGYAPVSDDSSGPSISSTPSLPAKPSDNSSGKSILSGLLALLANGGPVEKGFMCARMAGGGYVPPTPLVVTPGSQGPQSFVGQWVNSNVPVSQIPSIAAPSLPQAPQKSGGGLNIGQIVKGIKGKGSSQNSGPVLGENGEPQQIIMQTNEDKALQDSAGTSTIPESDLNLRNSAGTSDTGSDVSASDSAPSAEWRGGYAARGGNVKARSAKERAKVKGDDEKNDKIPALLSQGEEVIDRETLADPGPVGQMARAVAKHINQRNKQRAQ